MLDRNNSLAAIAINARSAKPHTVRVAHPSCSIPDRMNSFGDIVPGERCHRKLRHAPLLDANLYDMNVADETYRLHAA